MPISTVYTTIMCIAADGPGERAVLAPVSAGEKVMMIHFDVHNVACYTECGIVSSPVWR